MTLVLEPFANTELVLSGTEEAGLLFGMLAALHRISFWLVVWIIYTHIIKDHQHFTLSGSTRG